MVIANRPGGIGVVLATAFGFWMEDVLPAGLPGRESLSMNLGALFLGVYALTVDRCEVPGLLASYKANVKNLFALAAESGLGTYHTKPVPGRRLSFFVLPVVIAPVIVFLLSFADVVRVQVENGRLTPKEIDDFFSVPGACLIAWWAYALVTERLGLRRRIGGKARDHLGFH
jgi:hypothetical protein